jgi:hypothetical protein
MKKTIFTVAVPMQDQTQCDRMKAVCLENGLPIWEDEIAFILPDFDGGFFGFDDKETKGDDEFFVFEDFKDLKGKTQVTEAEFMELLKEYKSNEDA